MISPKELKETLDELQDKSKFEECLQNNFNLIANIVNLVTENELIENNFIGLIDDFYLSRQKRGSLLLWAVEQEIKVTDNSSELFRMQSISTQMLFRTFFSGSGLYYINKTVSHVLKSIIILKEESLELVPNGISVSVEEANKNLNNILNLTRSLFELLNDHISLIPNDICRCFITMKKFATHKFPEVRESVVPVVFFLRCLCPAILQPEQFGLTKEKLPPPALKSLIIISKLLQNIANGIIKNNVTTYAPHDTLILNFIQEHIQTVKKFCTRLVDETQLSSSKKADSSKISTEIDDKVPQPTVALDNIYQFVFQGKFSEILDRLVKKQINSEKEQEQCIEDHKAFVKKVDQLANDNPWKPIKSSWDMSVSSLKGVPFLFKISSKINCSVNKIKTMVDAISFQEWIDDIWGSNCLVTDKCNLISKEGNVERWSMRIKFSSILISPRTAIVDKSSAFVNGRYIVLLKSTPVLEGVSLDVSFEFTPHNLQSSPSLPQKSNNKRKSILLMTKKKNLFDDNSMEDDRSNISARDHDKSRDQSPPKDRKLNLNIPQITLTDDDHITEVCNLVVMYHLNCKELVFPGPMVSAFGKEIYRSVGKLASFINGTDNPTTSKDKSSKSERLKGQFIDSESYSHTYNPPSPRNSSHKFSSSHSHALNANDNSDDGDTTKSMVPRQRSTSQSPNTSPTQEIKSSITAATMIDKRKRAESSPDTGPTSPNRDQTKNSSPKELTKRTQKRTFITPSNAKHQQLAQTTEPPRKTKSSVQFTNSTPPSSPPTSRSSPSLKIEGSPFKKKSKSIDFLSRSEERTYSSEDLLSDDSTGSPRRIPSTQSESASPDLVSFDD
eukprot:TRINITY_DN6609_c0_g1_i2.p1 TRINITY_DN6609_c0_g1~~TRINITY_DN6609_c0_g1_i2.p1  ORF type:complete len:842 (+),score=111.24 TRINITY_DN6609_c0_g1_i2:13-2538(+)